MLVCNVSMRPPRRAIAAELAEAVTAADAPGTGNVVFATLVDDPASVNEIVDAYLGEIMLEAASADAVIDATIPATIAAAIVESVTAADTQDGTAAVSTVTWDPATVTAVTLSGGNLVATNTGTTSVDQGAKVASASGKSSGKYYFELKLTTIASGFGGGNCGVGVGTTSSTYTNMGNGGTTGIEHYVGGSTYSNGSQVLAGAGGYSTGNVIGLAVDLDNRRFWFRLAPSGNWNNSGTANPATNTGGLIIPAGTMVPFITFGGGSGVANNVFTANFGASSFSGAVPSGFTSGWTA